ncbi:MAG TPA: DUF2188 domain-containing protein [Chitinophagales bacterium]|nr:DUF2188 domain-containing protein [Chitinophagales bacterium]
MKQKLPKFTLEFNEKKNRWDLQADKSGRVVKTFETKEEATTGGVLKKAVGKEGGSVKIQLVKGKFEEERTYPKSADPRRSKG